MSRTMHDMGLTETASDWLVHNCVLEEYDYCPHCGKPTKNRLKIIHAVHLDTFFASGPILHMYELVTGGYVEEIVQVEPWSSGPWTFLCLRLDTGKRIGEWRSEDHSLLNSKLE